MNLYTGINVQAPPDRTIEHSDADSIRSNLGVSIRLKDIDFLITGGSAGPLLTGAALEMRSSLR